jgi:23S rRNA pseudouridine1911/1915/1917 synthase
MDDKPYIIEESEDYAVVYKPCHMHSVRKIENDNNLFDWYKEKSKNFFDIMHRLDYETQGLVLFAKNEKTYNFFKDLQDNGDFIKEYSAVCLGADEQQGQGFPPFQDLQLAKTDGRLDETFVIESFFRPFGPGRKQVRPVIEDGKKHKEVAADKGSFYKTYIIKINAIERHDTGTVKIPFASNIKDYIFNVQIKRGFRHQIRCHLAWIGYPIKGDPLYSQPLQNYEPLALRSHALFFTDPSSGQKRECRIEPLAKP